MTSSSTNPNIFVRVFAAHVGFHALFVLLYVVSLSGLFLLIPLIGLYNAFVLGFLGESVIASPARAVALGFLVFGASGLFSGWVISLIRPKSVWVPAFLSLFVTAIILVSASWMNHKAVGVGRMQSILQLQLPVTTGRADVDELSMALKAEYHLSEPAVPLYLTGKETIVPLNELQPSLQALSKGFQLSGGPYLYCNLPSQVWRGLKKDAAGQCALLWSPQPDANGKHLLISVDLKSDIFSDEFVTAETLRRALTNLESAVQKQTGDTKFTLTK